MECIIVSNGQIRDYNFYIDIIKNADYIICADGGAKHLFKMGIAPHVIIGDLDSITLENKNRFLDLDVEFIQFSKEKDATDTELATDYAISKGATDITYIGVIGTRLDHSLANIYLLKYLLEKNITGRIVDEYNDIILIKDRARIIGKTGDFLSIIPLSKIVYGVSLTGLKYPLTKCNIKLGSSLGISNEFVEEEALIDLEKGLLLVIKSRD